MVVIVWIAQRTVTVQTVKGAVKIITNAKITIVWLVIAIPPVLAVCNVMPKENVSVNRASLAINATVVRPTTTILDHMDARIAAVLWRVLTTTNQTAILTQARAYAKRTWRAKGVENANQASSTWTSVISLVAPLAFVTAIPQSVYQQQATPNSP